MFTKIKNIKVSIAGSICILLSSCNLINSNNPTRTIEMLPSFNILLLDSTTVLNSKNISKGNAMLFLYFKTDCPYCMEETQTLLKHINSLKDVQICFLTEMSLKELQKYSDTYNLESFKNIIVAKDLDYSFAEKFKPKTVPFIAIYNTNNKLIRIYKGGTSFTTLLEAIKS